ncbi:MAG: DNA polymerase III subunit beta [Dehalococcoidia bacterium]|nr:DNA polymerase III subunit beta [Dehalococcoidia bacterium]
MRVSCSQENLSKGLGIVGRAVATRTTLPITGNVMLSAEESRLKLSATNLEVYISCWVPATVEEEGAITVPARLLTELVASLPNQLIDMNLQPDGKLLELTCARNTAKLGGLPAADFPATPSFSDGAITSIDPKVLHSAISRVAFAAATDESRPVLTGVLIQLDEGGMTLAAADGFRLAVQRTPIMEPVAAGMSIIVPSRSLSELSRLLTDETDPVQMMVSSNHNQVFFHLKNADMISQLMPGTFPNYSQLIPKEHSTRAVVGLAELKRAIRTASIFARDGSGIIRLQVENGGESKLIISSRAEEIGEHEGQLDVTVEGEPMKIAFNNRYLGEVLNVLDCKEVALETTTPSSPGVIKPVDSEDYTHVVMPMFVQW